MIEGNPEAIALRNRVRLHVYDFLMQFDKDSLHNFPQQFTAWSRFPSRESVPNDLPIYRLSNFLRHYFQQQIDIQAPATNELQAVYRGGSELDSSAADAIRENDPTGFYKASLPPVRDEAYRRLMAEGFHPGSSNADQILNTASLAVSVRLSLLLTGEAGTGKRRLARLIHRLGPDASKPLIFIHAGDLTPGSIRHRMNSGATLVIIEAGGMSAVVQDALRDVLDEITDPALARIISTDSGDLEHLVDEGRFRRDLFHRLSLIALELPPLRQRLGDLEELSEYFIQRFRDANRVITGERLSYQALDKLRAHSWPGNFKELQAVLRRALTVCPDRLVDPEYISYSPDDY